jgi:hypothetical protein
MLAAVTTEGSHSPADMASSKEKALGAAGRRKWRAKIAMSKRKTEGRNRDERRGRRWNSQRAYIYRCEKGSTQSSAHLMRASVALPQTQFPQKARD